MAPVDIDKLLEYIKYNDATELEDSLNRNEVDPNQVDKDGWSLLHHACMLGQMECVEVLVKNDRVDVNQKGPERMTPLFLLKHQKINTSVKDANGKTVIDLVKEYKGNNKKELYKMFGIEDVNEHPEVSAPKEINENLETKVVEEPEIDLTVTDDEGLTPLHRAAKDGDVESLRKYLRYKSVDVNAKGEAGFAPLHYAAGNGHAECVRLLLEHKDIDVNAKANETFWQGYTPLHYAAEYGAVDCVRLLLAHKDIDVNAEDKYGDTPLHYAAMFGKSECVKVLLAHKDIDVNANDKNGWTPLHYAASSGETECVKVLLAHKDIDVNAKDDDGRTPLKVAWKQEIIKLLEEHGAHR